MKGIIFKGPLFNAVLEGHKTQTRRIINPQPDNRGLRTSNTLFEDWHGSEAKPRYNAGEIVYLKEPYIDDLSMDQVFYKFNAKDIEDVEAVYGDLKSLWKNKLFMPADVARYFIKIANVRAERIADISEEDAIAEGIVETGFGCTILPMPEKCIPMYTTAKSAFRDLWNSINDKYKSCKDGVKRKYPFDGPKMEGKKLGVPNGPKLLYESIPNPWVWVYKFEFLEDYSLTDYEKDKR